MPQEAIALLRADRFAVLTAGEHDDSPGLSTAKSADEQTLEFPRVRFGGAKHTRSYVL
jgi:hypothetical protein